MYKFLVYTSLSFLSLCLAAQPPFLKDDFRFTKEQLQQDVDSLHAWLKQTHPQLYFHSDSAVTEERWIRERAKLNQPLTVDAFEDIISPLVSQYNDGHLYIDINFDRLESKGNCLFPAGVIISGNNIYVKDTVSSILPGSSIESINGIKTGIIIKKILSVVPGDHLQNKEATASRLFPYYFGRFFGFTSGFKIKLSGKKKVISVNAISLAAYYKQLFPAPVWSLKLYTGYSLAVIECTNYEGKIAGIRQTLDSFFTIIRQKNIGHVALDLRRNGGGNSLAGDVFLSYITPGKVQGIAAKIYRESPQLVKLNDTEWPKSEFLEAIKSWKKNGAYYENVLSADVLPYSSNTSLLFKGKFYLLTSARTYSSAHITAMQVKCNKLGTIIGQPTGEDLHLTGEVIAMVLPNTKIVFNCPVVMYRPACDNMQRLGVQPDIPVFFSQEALLKGQDSEMEMLKRIILQDR